MAGNHVSYKLWGFHVQTKSNNLQTDRKPHLLGGKCPGGRQRKVGKRRNLLCSYVTCWSFFLTHLFNVFDLVFNRKEYVYKSHPLCH